MQGYDYRRIKRIVELLRDGPRAMKELWTLTGWQYITLRRYIKFMEQEGLVRVRLVGRGRTRRLEIELVKRKVL